MIDIKKELTSYELERLIEQIKSSNDIEDAMLILQMIGINLEQNIEEEENLIEESQEFSEQEKKKLNEQLLNKKELKNKIDNILDDFINRPSAFFNLEEPIDTHINKKIGFEIIPKNKSERSLKAENIFKSICKTKLIKIDEKYKKVNLTNENKDSLIRKLDKVNKNMFKDLDK